ncbi:MAG: SRPBCC family protein, partial [Bacteroidota bacterium]
LLVGVFKPTVNYGSELEINKPVEEAWAVMMDESKMADWLIGYKSAELLSGTKNEVGAVSKIIMHPPGEEMMEMKETITAMKENEHLGMKFEMDLASSTLDMYFEEKNGKTIMRSKAAATGGNIFMKSMLAMMSSQMRQQDEEIMNNLKKVIEENTTDYFPAPVSEATSTEENLSTENQH